MSQPGMWSECYDKLVGVCAQFDLVMTNRASARVIDTDPGRGKATVAADFSTDERPIGSKHEEHAWRDLEAGFLSSGFIAEPPAQEPCRVSWDLTLLAETKAGVRG